jgi:hypothetical protein
MSFPSRAIAQVISRWLPTAATRVRTRLRLCGICDGQSGARSCFLRVPRFPMQILILPTAPYKSIILRAGTIGPNNVLHAKRILPYPAHTMKKEANHEFTSGYLVSQSRFETSSSRIQVYSVIAIPDTFGKNTFEYSFWIPFNIYVT